MARISFPELVHEVSLKAGAPIGRESLGDAVEIVLAVVAAELPDHDREALKAELPVALRPLPPGEGDVFGQVARALDLPMGPAIELTESVLAVLGVALDDDLRLRLQKHLPASLGSHLEPRPVIVPPGRQVVRASEPPPERHTLSSGRVGSSHPLSESAPKTAHQHSVAANPDPHGDTRLSGARR